ncbi:MAG: hypothetical protein BWY07_02331 [Candidatus Hydrogenedentes bacterium ADurb.Bin170]|nr:MAG: hypothetical protein BWY07_02331 [Candidatus Hydrogenedentes bacterium ADurb.Bin170]
MLLLKCNAVGSGAACKIQHMPESGQINSSQAFPGAHLGDIAHAQNKALQRLSATTLHIDLAGTRLDAGSQRCPGVTPVHGMLHQIALVGCSSGDKACGRGFCVLVFSVGQCDQIQRQQTAEQHRCAPLTPV